MHAHDAPIKALTQRRDAYEEIEHRVRYCQDSRGIAHPVHWRGFDGRLPSVAGWPRHPFWANASQAAAQVSTHTLEKELNGLRNGSKGSWKDGTDGEWQKELEAELAVRRSRAES